ncbi:hypothetical protein Q4534_02600 [Cyclobacterium sp. 1_MG-2023]|uniref:hypothetical protein n=1 Tax=Cyclobacterium sp. 1_MG-2023 TaxID=3062681 RepID=UPI0026E151F3|nr:hypothetical protein [Cyclobacterium sp. 1_MG-2023]MDO6436276.1 hypothetical protein [Cyclobacterium sp. 1_MG-2023]
MKEKNIKRVFSCVETKKLGFIWYLDLSIHAITLIHVVCRKLFGTSSGNGSGDSVNGKIKKNQYPSMVYFNEKQLNSVIRMDFKSCKNFQQL